MADFVVTSKIKDKVKDLGFRMSGDLPDAVDAKVAELLRAAAARARENGRSTLRNYDL